MHYVFVPMSKEYAFEIAYKWKYDGLYSFYDMTADEDDLKDCYEKIGFHFVEKYLQKTNGREFEFIKMKKDIQCERI